MKTKSQGPGHPPGPHAQPQPPTHAAPAAALEEKITHLTEEAAKTANRLKVPILVAVVAIVAIVAISGLVSTISRQQDAGRSEKLYLLFEKDDAQIRTEAPALASEFEGTRIEPAFISRYATWLFEQDQPGDREKALALITAARSRHERSLLLELTAGELEQVHAASAGFVLPALPAPIEPPTPPVTPVGIAPVEGNSLAPASPSEEKAAPPAEETPSPPAPGATPGSGGR